MDDDMIYYAKSPNSQGYQQTVKEHLLVVAERAQKFGTPIGLDTAAELAGQTHDFGKYSQAFQEVLRGIRTGGGPRHGRRVLFGGRLQGQRWRPPGN